MASTRRSAGIVLYRRTTAGLEVLLGHMGGPYWALKDAGAWTIPKGEYSDGDDPLTAARREYAEEIGHEAPTGEMIDLGEIRQSGGKVVRAWAIEGDLDPATQVSNTFDLEWPPRSGAIREFPEIDRVAWFDLATASTKIVTAQRTFLDRLAESDRRPAPV